MSDADDFGFLGGGAARPVAHLMDRAEVARALNVLAADGLREGETFELRILGAYPLSGRFVSVEAAVDALAAHAAAVEVWAGGQHRGMAGAYFTPNPLTLPPSSCLEGGESATDGDVSRRRWFLLDVDPEREKVDDGTGKLAKGCATDAEKAEAWAVRERILSRLCGDLGWPRPVLCDSGNGYHALWAVDLPAVSDLPRRALTALAAEFDTDGATVDLRVFNPSRIWKLPGTLAIKGPNKPERPWRRARLEDVPERIQRVTREQLETLAPPVEAPTALPLSTYDRPNAAYADLADARAAYRRDRTPADWPTARTGRCPVHDNDGCFKVAAGSNGERWICWSSNHPSTCGQPARNGSAYGGDVLDVDRYLSGKTEAELLRDAGYLGERDDWRSDPIIQAVANESAARFLEGGRRGDDGGAFLEDAIRADGAPPAVAPGAPGAPGAPVVASTKSAPGVRRGSGVGWPAPPPLGRLNLSQAIPPPDREMLLNAPDGESFKGFLPSGIVGLLIAGGGTGKTQALIQLALTVATGADWLGTYKLAPRRVGTGTGFGRVLLALGEEDEEEINRRLWKAVEALDLWRESDAINRLIVPYPLLGVQCGLTWSDDGKSPETPTEWSARFREMLAADAAINGPWRCIILDPATRFMGANGETDNKAATEWVREVSRLVELDGGPTVLIAHHSTKSALKEGGADQTAARGSSALVDGARWVANLGRGRGHVKGEIVLSLTKHNYVGPAAPVSLLYDSKGYLRKMTDEERETLTVEALVAGLEATAREAKAKQDAKDKHEGKPAVAVDLSPLPASVTGNVGQGRPAPKASTKSAAGGGDDDGGYF